MIKSECVDWYIFCYFWCFLNIYGLDIGYLLFYIFIVLLVGVCLVIYYLCKIVIYINIYFILYVWL